MKRSDFIRRWNGNHRRRSKMAEEITFENVEDKSDKLLFKEGCGCQLCLKNAAKYTCPRCNVTYCSLACYKSEKHMKCSEVFYKKCVMEALQDDTIDRKGRAKMMEILERQREEVNEEDRAEDLEERLEGLNLDKDSEKIWSKLTEEERRKFEKAVDTGYIGSLLVPWVPWWINTQQRSSTDKTSEITKRENSSNSQIPKILKNVPHLESLLKSKQASSDMKYNLINILYSYVYICRFYNGGQLDFIQEAIEGLWKLSTVLYQNVNFTSLDSALRSSIESSQQHEKYHNSIEFSLSVIQDVSLLLKGTSDSEQDFVEFALSDMHRLFTKGGHCYKSQKTTSDVVKSVWLAKKKVYFMLAWYREYQDVCWSIEHFIPVITEAVKMEFKQHEDERRKMEKSRICGKNKKLIEEI